MSRQSLPLNPYVGPRAGDFPVMDDNPTLKTIYKQLRKLELIDSPPPDIDSWLRSPAAAASKSELDACAWM